VNEESGTYQLGTLSGEVLPQWANGFRLKPYYGKLLPNTFLPKDDSEKEKPYYFSSRDQASSLESYGYGGQDCTRS
jgi:hypothetical protein